MVLIVCGSWGIAMANEALKALINKYAQYTEIPENFEALRVEGDRTLAIIAAVLVENALENLLEEGWHRSEAHDVGDRKLRGPSGNFASKIKDCFALGLIGPVTRDELDSIREIRNAFAHTGRLIGFHTKEVADACEILPATEQEISPRDRYWRAAWDLFWGFQCWSGDIDRMNSWADPEDRRENLVFP
jgi:hypothetical protein